MYQRHQSNTNLTLTNDTEWKGLPLLSRPYPYIADYLDAIHRTISQSIEEHRRVTAIRFDLRLPDMMDNPDLAVITRFIESLKAKLKAEENAKRREGKRVHPSGLRYIWAKERSGSHHVHYHCCIFLNQDAYCHLGTFVPVQSEGARAQNMAMRIREAWASALSISMEASVGLVHFPENRVYRIDANSEGFYFQVMDLFRRLSYLAKADTKQYGDASKSFGYSRNMIRPVNFYTSAYVMSE